MNFDIWVLLFLHNVSQVVQFSLLQFIRHDDGPERADDVRIEESRVLSGLSFTFLNFVKKLK